MTASTAIPISNTPDYLAGALLQHLTRPPRQARVGSVAGSLIVAILTLGIWPIIRWPQRFRNFVLIQRNQLWHLSEWVRLQSGYPGADKLHRAVERVRFRLALWLMSLILVGAAAMEIGYVAQRSVWDMPQVYTSLYRRDLPAVPPWTPRQRVHFVWVAVLTAAYLLHWVQVQLHARDVRRVVRALNDLTRREGVASVALPRAGLGLDLRWLLVGAVLSALGAWWGFGLALAAGVHTKLVERQTPRVRRRMADALRTMLLLRRPSMRVPAEVLPSRRCANEGCQHRLPDLARFCPRCGRATI